MNPTKGRLLHRIVFILLVAVVLSSFFAVQTLPARPVAFAIGTLLGIIVGFLAGRLEIRQMGTRLRGTRYVERRRKLAKTAVLLGGLVVLGAVLLLQLDLNLSALSAYLGVPFSTAFATMLVVIILWLWKHEHRHGRVYVDVAGTEE